MSLSFSSPVHDQLMRNQEAVSGANTKPPIDHSQLSTGRDETHPLD